MSNSYDEDLERAIKNSLVECTDDTGMRDNDTGMRDNANYEKNNKVIQPQPIVKNVTIEPSKDQPQPGMVLKTTIENGCIRRYWEKPR